MKSLHHIKRKSNVPFMGVTLHKILCTCGTTLGGWTPQEAEEAWEKHKEES